MENKKTNTILLIVLLVLVLGFGIYSIKKDSSEVKPEIASNNIKTNEVDKKNFTKVFSISKADINANLTSNTNFPGFTVNYNADYDIVTDISNSCGTDCMTPRPYLRGISINKIVDYDNGSPVYDTAGSITVSDHNFFAQYYKFVGNEKHGNYVFQKYESSGPEGPGYPKFDYATQINSNAWFLVSDTAFFSGTGDDGATHPVYIPASVDAIDLLDFSTLKFTF